MRIKQAMQGGGLVEVLVALVLMSVGMLGMLAAHSTALRWTKQSEHRSTALWLTQDLAERVRANRGKSVPADTIGAAYVTTLDASSQAQAPDMPDELCNRVQSACTVAQMAAADLASWRQLVRERLPGGVVWVTYTAGILDIWVSWLDAPDDVSTVCPSDLRVSDASQRCFLWQVTL